LENRLHPSAEGDRQLDELVEDLKAYQRDCPGLTSLPAGLSVGGWLALAGCPGLTSLPAGLSVGGDLDLAGCPGLGVDAIYRSVADARQAIEEAKS
jgi:hypothetical protein